MRSILRRLLSRHTTAVAYLALFAALGGSAYAAVTVTGKNIKDGTVTGKDIRSRTIAGGDIKGNSLSGAQINESGLGQVPTAASAGSAQSAQTAQTARSAQSAQTAQSAHSAQNAENLGGRPASDYARNGAEAVRVIGASGEIPFNTGWGFGGIPNEEEVPGYWKDSAGTVHLRGAAGRSSGTAATMFTLPPGYRPNLDQWFITYGAAKTQAYVSIEANGDIVWHGGTNANGAYDNSSYVGLGNITFRADQ
jgi:hypothetical protein